MPRDDNKQLSINNKANNVSKNNKSQRSSSGSLSSSPDDALLRHSGNNKNPIKSTSNKSGNNNSSNIRSSKSSDNKSEKSQNLKNKALNLASKAPVVGKYAQAAKLAINGVNAIKNMAKKKEDDTPEGIKNNKENRLKNAFGLLGAGVGLQSLLGDKSDSNKENSNNEKSSAPDDGNNISSGLMKTAMTVPFLLPIILLVVVVVSVIVIVCVISLIASGEKISSYKMNYISSTIRGEELIEGDLDFSGGNTNSDEEKYYIQNLTDVYNQNNKNFNPDLVSSTFQVMIDYAKDYAKDGKFNYTDINAGCNFFTKNVWLNFGDSCKISDLAGRLKGSQVESGNQVVINNNNTSTVEGVAAVASDAGTAVGNISGGFGRNEPANLVDTGRKSLDDNGCRLTADAWAAFQVMEQAAAADGVTIGVNSCYRSYDEQAGTTGNSPASAGYSEHQMGSTIDIADHDSGYIDTPAVNNWLYAHAAEYGFINRYYDMPDETHHFRFVGSSVAAAYGKYNTSAPGARPHYSMSYESFVNSDEGRSVIGDSSTSNSTSKSTSNSKKSTSKSTSSSSSSSSGGSADAIISIAEKEVGTGEQNNTTKYGIWYGLPDGEWCAMFVSWCANQAGVAEDVIPKYALVSDGRNFFKSRGLYHSVSDSSYTPKKGDVIFYSHGHTGLVKDYQNGMVTTIEGNTSSYTNPVVAEKTFNPLAIDIDGYGDVQYTNKSSTSSSGNTTTGNINNDENYRDTIKEFILQQFDENKISEERADKMVTEIFEFKNDYYDLIGKEFVDCNVASATANRGGTSCNYDIKGFATNQGDIQKEMQVSDLKVRLMQCSDGTYGQPVPGEELIDFEKYILGVTYAEVGEDFAKEGAKSEAIAARSYALARPTVMGGAMGTALIQENNQWILQLRSCTDDQVYCDPDRGCSMDSSAASRTHYSGTDHAYVYKLPLAPDHPLRSYVAETNGQVLVNNKEYIVNADYFDSDQRSWNARALQGFDVNQILVEHYAKYNASSIKSMSCDGSTTTKSSNPACTGVSNNNAGTAASGDYVNWKQHDPRWAGVALGDSDMGHIGCTITAIAMLVARSGVPAGNITDFNPGTFAEALKAAGVTHSDGNTDIGRISEVIPGFQYVGGQEFDITDNSNEAGNAIKVAKAKELLDQGYYVIIQGTAMYSGGGHWEALDRVENGRIYMLDPYHDNGDLLASYRATYAFYWYKAVK